MSALYAPVFETLKASPSQQVAWKYFVEQGFPSKKNEHWRYTDLKKIVSTAFGLPTQFVTDFVFEDNTRLVFINGRFVQEYSRLPATGVRVTSSVNDSAPLNAFTALNAAFMPEGTAIEIFANIEEPIDLIFIANEAETLRLPRVLLTVAQNCSATVNEIYTGEVPGFTNAVSNFTLQENATLNHTRFVDEQGLYVSQIFVEQQRQSTYNLQTTSIGSELCRTDLTVMLNGELANCNLNGLYLANKNHYVDYHTLLQHKAPNTQSREFFKGILANNGEGVFNGKILVEQGAHKTDAGLSNKNILLSPQATVNTKPELEIYDNDVKCAHGATVGQLDAQALFYLRSRGIELKEARKKLTEAFAYDVLHPNHVAKVQQWLQHTTEAL